MPDPFARGVSAEDLRRTLNGWPTFAAQKIDIVEMAADWTRAVVRLDLTPENANYFGTAFGGSLFSMVDPFLVILLANQLGEDYAVWDKVVEIDFVRPGTGPVTAVVDVPAEVAAEVRAATDDGSKLLRWFEVPLTMDDGTVVAVQKRQIYVRRRRPTT